MSLASRERAALSDEVLRVGPDHPTLCAGWTTRDLLAHLLVRERQPLAAPGILIKAFAGVTERAMDEYRSMRWEDAVAMFRGGPHSWSPMRFERVDAAANGVEFFVHHEDVRRGEPGWEPRPADPERDNELWAGARRIGMLLRRSPVGVVLERPTGERQVVKTGAGVVTVVGEPGEILLFAFGRDAVRVEVQGEPDDVAAFRAAPRGV
ncbi:TIGR03085 family metal-binding protein [Pseudonocardia zijingensis]|uniref:TIGR03085 family metal-binding protein n=1 Tax=Pseudonocardia zijingensis TaxID=153376 RepID=A0ABN1QJF0_9PSEU